jgi:hypothetical protein
MIKQSHRPIVHQPSVIKSTVAYRLEAEKVHSHGNFCWCTFYGFIVNCLDTEFAQEFYAHQL